MPTTLLAPTLSFNSKVPVLNDRRNLCGPTACRFTHDSLAPFVAEDDEPESAAG
jgi:hypothetical protein